MASQDLLVREHAFQSGSVLDTMRTEDGNLRVCTGERGGGDQLGLAAARVNDVLLH